MKFGKRTVSVILTLILIICVVPVSQAYATEPVDTIVVTKDLGDDVTVTTTIEVYPSMSRNTSTSAIASSEFTRGDEWIATITLKAYFTYNGMTAGVTDTEYAKVIASGWSYTNHKITTTNLSTSDGGTATLTGKLKKGLIGIPVDISLHCSPKGIITTN